MAEAKNQSQENEVKFESIAHRAPTMVTQALKGIKFPATRDQLVDTARANNALESVIETIGKLPEGNYQQMIDVTHNFGRSRQR